jgi:ABC-type branched-subunit amino acid transport system ATPase component/predicted MFS family arabinose efflux permease
VADLDAVERRPMIASVREQRLGRGTDDVAPSAPHDGAPAPPPPPGLTRVERARRYMRQADPRSIESIYGNRPLYTLILLFTVGGFELAVFSIFGPEIKKDLGIKLASLGAITTVTEVVKTFLAPVFGWLADRRKRITIYATGVLIGNILNTFVGVAGSYAVAFGVRTASGVAGAVGEPTMGPLLADYYPREYRVRAYAFLDASVRAAQVVGPLVAGGIGILFGWRVAAVSLGLVSIVLTLPIFTLREPVRGYYDRIAMGATEEAAADEQEPMSWGESWRAAAGVNTVRRIWYATPFLSVSGVGFFTLTNFYLAERYGIGPAGRTGFAMGTAVVGLVAVVVAAPYADRLLAVRPSRMMTLYGVLLGLNAVPTLLLVVAPSLVYAIVPGVLLGIVTAMAGPASGALMSVVIPARLRGLGMQTVKPWALIGGVAILGVYHVADIYGLRTAILLLIPIWLTGAVIMASGAGGVEADIQNALAASIADQEARRARAEGTAKLLVSRDVSVAYNGTRVLFGVDFDVDDGELVALVGTNGAGKSTLLRAIAGVQVVDGGAIFLDGRDVTYRPPQEHASHGVVFVPGGHAVFPSLTVEDNLRTAGFLRRSEPAWVAERIEEVLELFPVLRERLHEVAGNLSGGEQQMLAIGQSFLLQPRLLMIDELSLGLAPAIVERLLDVVRRINAEGTTVVLVEQSLNVALTVARRAVFLDKGKVRFDGPVEELLGRTDLVRSVFLAGGGAGVSRRPVRAAPTHLRVTDVEPALVARDLAVSFGGVQALRGAAVTVQPGQVVGVIGPNGAGKTTLFDAISGFVKPDAGEVHIGGVDVAGLAPDARARLGLARSFQNARLFPSMTVRENIAVALETQLAVQSAVLAAGWAPSVQRSERRIRRRVENLIGLFSLGAFADKFLAELSTGSRRIVDLACIMASEPKLLLLDEPSSGLAQAETEALGPVVRRLARDTGCGVLVIEHDIPLVTSLADHLVAMELGATLLEGLPEMVVADPIVVKAYLGADPSVVERSGQLTRALEHAGLLAGTDVEDA